MNGGVAFYGGKPVLISAGGGLIAISDFPNGENPKNILAADPDLDLASPVLGYVNMPEYCLYVYRKPERKYKQTLTYGSIGWFDPSNMGVSLALRQNNIFYTKHFKDMLENIYPNLNAVLKALGNGKIKSRAISRNVALGVDSFGIIRVYYKMTEVGYISPGTTTVSVPEGKLAWVISKYLREYSWEVV
jgi:hypothetical protein